MRKSHGILATLLLYAALGTGANAGDVDPATLEALKAGDMRKLAVHKQPEEGSSVSFTTEDGQPLTLADFEGRTVLLNFWATWCAPCRKEMPSLDAAQVALGGPNFEVVAVATGRNDVDGIKKFFADHGVDNLKIYLDPKSALARDMGVLGLPITLILNTEGKEIARLRGDADWADENALAILRAAIGDEAS